MFYDREKCSSFSLISWLVCNSRRPPLAQCSVFFPAPVGRLVSAPQTFQPSKSRTDTTAFCKNCYFRWVRPLQSVALTQKAGDQVLSHWIKETIVYLLLCVKRTAVRDYICLFFLPHSWTDVQQMLFVIVLSAVLNQSALAGLIIGSSDFFFLLKKKICPSCTVIF